MDNQAKRDPRDVIAEAQKQIEDERAAYLRNAAKDLRHNSGPAPELLQARVRAARARKAAEAAAVAAAASKATGEELPAG